MKELWQVFVGTMLFLILFATVWSGIMLRGLMKAMTRAVKELNEKGKP